MPENHQDVELDNGNGVAAQPVEPEQPRRLGWDSNENNTLLVVATLITTLTYQLGTNLPGGYWQDDNNGHMAGNSIMRDKHRKRYWLFMTGSWAGFTSSMLMTLALLIGVPAKSKLVRWPFTVAYSCLVLNFITSQPNTDLAFALWLWAVVLFLLLATVSLRNWDRHRWRDLFRRLKDWLRF